MRHGTVEVAGRKVRSSAERPRERLLTFGPQALTDVELLAVVLGTGFGIGMAAILSRLAIQ
jgi:DNA repair protein RadC